MVQNLVLGDGLRRNAIRFPEKEALIFKDKRLTYRNLNRHANRLSNALIELGMSKGDKVGVLLNNCTEFFEILFGLRKAGIVMVPMNTQSTTSDLEYMINLCDVKTLIFSEELSELVLNVKPRLNRATRFISITQALKTDGENYNDLLSSASENEPDVLVNEMDPLWIVFTSGTTGKPKACVLCHRGWTLQNLLLPIEYEVTINDIYLNTGYLHFLGQFWMCVVYLYIGATVVLMKKADPLEVLKLIHKEKITQSLIVPTLSNFILNLPEENKFNWDLSSFRTLISATAALPTKTKQDLLNFFKNTELYELYSASELGMVTTLRPEDQLRKTRCCGKPFIGVEIKLLDERGKEVSTEELGELYMKGFNTFKEYYKDQESTKNSRNGEWVSVGDVARMDDEGYYYIVDRKKDMVNSGGVCIYPSEIDDVIQEHPSVLEVAVIGVPDETWGESLKALVVIKSGEKTTEEEIKKFCKNKLSRFKIPKTIEFLSFLPKSASGKILKKELRSKYWKGHDVKV